MRSSSGWTLRLWPATRSRVPARLGLSLALAALVLLTVAGSASAAVTTVQFSAGHYAAAVGQALPPISVTVTDENNAPVAGVTVAFSVTPDSTGATATLSAATATTDSNGVAQVTATAGAQAGYPAVHATAGGVSADATIVNRPPGYRPGEQLASIVAPNQDDVTENVRDGLADKQTFLIVDVCAGFCVPCANYAAAVEAAITQLAAQGVTLKLVTLLKVGASDAEPSVQSDALAWKANNHLTGSVLHAGGSTDSALYRDAGYFLYDNDPGASNGAFPTHLLVDPKGNIIDRVLGFNSDTTQQTVDQILAIVNKTKAPSTKPPKVGPQGQISVQLPNGETHSDVFDTYNTQDAFDWGYVFLGNFGGTTQRSFGYVTPGLVTLPASGTLTVSLTRLDADKKLTLTSTLLNVTVFMYLGGEQVDIDTTLPAVQNGSTVTVTADLAALQTATRAQLEAGNFQTISDPTIYVAPLKPEVVTALVNATVGINVNALYNPPKK